MQRPCERAFASGTHLLDQKRSEPCPLRLLSHGKRNSWTVHLSPCEQLQSSLRLAGQKGKQRSFQDSTERRRSLSATPALHLDAPQMAHGYQQGSARYGLKFGFWLPH